MRAGAMTDDSSSWIVSTRSFAWNCFYKLIKTPDLEFQVVIIRIRLHRIVLPENLSSFGLLRPIAACHIHVSAIPQKPNVFVQFADFCRVS